MAEFANTFGGAPLSLQQKTSMDDRLGTAGVPTSANPYAPAMQAPRGGPANPYGPSANGALFSPQNPYANAAGAQALQAGAYGRAGMGPGIQTPQGNGRGGTMFGAPGQMGGGNPYAGGGNLPKPPPLQDPQGNPVYGTYTPAGLLNFSGSANRVDPNVPYDPTGRTRGDPVAPGTQAPVSASTYAAPGRSGGSMTPEQQAAFAAAQRAGIDARPQGRGKNLF